MKSGALVRVYYPFHPLHGHELRVFVAARSPDGAATVEDASQIRLKIPLWMVTPDAVRFEVTDSSALNAQALLGLVEFCELHRSKLSASDSHLPTELTHETTLADQAIAPGRTNTDSSA